MFGSHSEPITSQATAAVEEHDMSDTSFSGRKVHFIGVGGCGMSGLAESLLAEKAVVSGSDVRQSSLTQRLTSLGGKIHTCQQGDNIDDDVDAVVISAAIKEDNEELIRARQMGVPVYKYSQMLGLLMRRRVGVAIAGTHGKSTTTAMVAYILSQAGDDPTFVIGATVDQLGGAARVGAGRHFVAEACEYDHSFLNLYPTIATILNIEEDHLDFYENIDAIVASFHQFAELVGPEGRLIVNGDDERAREAAENTAGTVVTFGKDDTSDYYPQNLALDDGCYRFDLTEYGQVLGSCRLALAGTHNVCNALAAAAVCRACDVPGEVICRSLSEFSGVQRRLTHKGRVRGITVLDDYAHHPTEIRATLQAVRQRYQPQRLVCVFQPHQHSRTRFLLRDFATSFDLADIVIVPDIYFVRDSQAERESVNAGDLVARIAQGGGNACYLPRFDQIEEYLKLKLRDGDVVVTMGAGNVWKIADELVCWLGTTGS